MCIRDRREVEDLVNSTKLFSSSLRVIENKYEKIRPTVKSIKQFENNSQTVSPDSKEITVQFSESLNGYNTGVDYGELGETAFPNITDRYWNSDSTAWTMAVELEANKTYQILISSNFRTTDGVHLKPYLIEFGTR